MPLTLRNLQAFFILIRCLFLSSETIRIYHEQLYSHLDDLHILKFRVLKGASATLFALGLYYPLMISLMMIYHHHWLTPCRF